MAIAILAIITVSTLYSYITALFAFIGPYPGTYPLDVIDANTGTFDTSNNPSASFSKGSTVRVKARVEKETGYYTNPPPDYTSYTSISGSSSYRVFITIKGPSGKVVQFYTATYTLNQGEYKDYTVDSSISSSATSGAYTVKILVWSTSLPSGVSQTPDIKTLTFTVT
jgi:hypothetical protein